MIKEQQYRRLVMLEKKLPLYKAADKAGMSERTARKYIRQGKGPDEAKLVHTWQTRVNVFEEIWPLVKRQLEINPGLRAKTLYKWLQKNNPGKYSEGQLRTFQRKIKNWRAIEGPEKEVMFQQVHKPGELSQSDFTHMDSVGVTINKELFEHLIYHFVLTYSNWEAGTICYSENLEALTEGLQDSLWEIGGVPQFHQMDQLSAAVNKMCSKEMFTDGYQKVLNHYRIKGRKIQVRKPNENGDLEQSHYRFKDAVKQALMLRGSSDFKSIEEYRLFLGQIFKELNEGRKKRFQEEQQVMRALPSTKIDPCKWERLLVRPGSTVTVDQNVYSVPSRLISEKVDIKKTSSTIELWYGQKRIETYPRLRGRGKRKIEYRHVIDSLVKKPGAFTNYRYKDEFYPSSRFRRAFDWLCENRGSKANKEYLEILKYAAKHSETEVDKALNWLMKESLPIDPIFVEDLITSPTKAIAVSDVTINKVNFLEYDALIREVA